MRWYTDTRVLLGALFGVMLLFVALCGILALPPALIYFGYQTSQAPNSKPGIEGEVFYSTTGTANPLAGATVRLHPASVLADYRNALDRVQKARERKDEMEHQIKLIEARIEAHGELTRALADYTRNAELWSDLERTIAANALDYHERGYTNYSYYDPIAGKKVSLDFDLKTGGDFKSWREAVYRQMEHSRQQTETRAKEWQGKRRGAVDALAAMDIESSRRKLEELHAELMLEKSNITSDLQTLLKVIGTAPTIGIASTGGVGKFAFDAPAGKYAVSGDWTDNDGRVQIAWLVPVDISGRQHIVLTRTNGIH